MQKVVFDPKAFDDLRFWAEEDKSTLIRIFQLVKDIGRAPFSGIGKPEPLKHEFKGYWSRRITQEHRLVYKVSGNEITIISCRFHYKK